MQYEFKRGQIVPKKLGDRFVSIHKKARHHLKFGCDVIVTVTPTVLKLEALSEGPTFFVKHPPTRKRNNGTRQKCFTVLRNVHFVPWAFSPSPVMHWHIWEPLSAIRHVSEYELGAQAQKEQQ